VAPLSATRIAAALALLWLGAPAGADPADGLEEQQRRDALKHYRKGDEALHAEKLEEAAREFNTAIRLDPLLTVAHYGLGQSYMGLRRYPDAVKAFEGCREAFLAVSNLGLRNAAEADRRRTEAIQALRESIALLQRNTRLATANQNSVRQLEERVRELERARQGGGEGLDVPAEVPFSLGSAYFRAGSLRDAEREYLAAIKANPKLGEAHSNLAVVYLLTDRPRDAQREVEVAEKAGFPVNPKLKQDIESKLR
jgi:tetratricopeptide (TPR) repeat protein